MESIPTSPVVGLINSGFGFGFGFWSAWINEALALQSSRFDLFNASNFSRVPDAGQLDVAEAAA